MVEVEDKILLKRRFKGLSTKGGIVTATAELHKLGGNQKAHFSFTTDNGCAHEDILDAFGKVPGAKLLVDVHLMDEDGTPMHAIDNGAYWLAEGKPEYTKKNLHLTDDEMKVLDGFWIEAMDRLKDDLKEMRACHCRSRGIADLKTIKEDSQKIEAFEKSIPYEAAKTAVQKASGQFHLPERWRQMAEDAKRYLREPDYEDPELEQFQSQDPMTESLLEIDGEILPVTWVNGFEIECGPSHRYAVFKDSKEAGKAARARWEDMAKNDPKEFACMVGEKTLVAWGLGQSASPGSRQVSSLKEWLDLWLDTPEEEFAHYDGEENDVKISAALADEMGIKRKKRDKWVPAVAYRS